MAQTLKPARELVEKKTPAQFPNESAEYRKARNALLVEEIELRRHIERVAEQRRQLPLGGEVTQRYQLRGEDGPVSFAELFRGNDTLLIYSYMLGPKSKGPCPMCTSLMSALDAKVPDIEQRATLIAIALGPIERLVEAKKARGWKHLRVYSDSEGKFSHDYVNAEGADIPGFNVFTRRNGKIFHFWAGEMDHTTTDPGQDSRGAPDLDPLWALLDTTPEGRGKDWYPKLSHE